MKSLIGGIQKGILQLDLFTKQTLRLTEPTYGCRGTARVEGRVRECGMDRGAWLFRVDGNRDLLH